MKKSSQETTLFDANLDKNQYLKTDKNKTTNVNILLNRVRLDKKRDFKKKIVFLSSLLLIVSVTAYFVLI
jgi:hypothetical protein